MFFSSSLNKIRNIHINTQKTNRTKKMPKQSKMRPKKKCTKVPYSLFCLFYSYAWGRGLSWSVVNILSQTPLDRAGFSFSGGYLLEIASWRGSAACIYLSIHSAGTPSGLKLHRPCECFPSLWWFISLLCLEDSVAFESTITYGSNNLSISSST